MHMEDAMNVTTGSIRPHHAQAARMWDLGGRHYDDVSFAISDALAHAAQRLAPRPGEAVLDIATGTGWSARNAARFGARVTGIDISGELLAAARKLSAHVEPAIEYRLADAEDLPFADAAFDRAISTFGIMFAAGQERAAGELARVVKPGGRAVIAAWPPGGAVEEFFGLIARHSGAAPPAQPPTRWGDPSTLESLLGDAFELSFEPGVAYAHHDDAQAIWDWYGRGFGPVRSLMDSLDPDALEAFRQDIDAYHDHYVNETGMLRIPRDYLVTIAHRR
jgi:SAM-dependent methyltransferase